MSVPSFNKPRLVFVMGPTCCGKSTLLKYMNERDDVGLVEVGRKLREKYSPEYFKGQNNPKHVAEEAWALCLSEIARCEAEGKSIILIDGQPRDTKQARLCAIGAEMEHYPKTFVLMDCGLEERERRARASRSGADLETLALPRLKEDMVAYYAVLYELLHYKVDIKTVNTNNPENLELRDFYRGVEWLICTRWA